MIRINCLKFIVAASIICFLVSVQTARADLVNGQFTSDLSEWIVDPEDSVLWEDGAAQFLQDDPENLLLYSNSTLSQEFTLNSQSLILSFYFKMNLEEITDDGNGEAETDIFTATLGGTTFYTRSSDDFFDDEGLLLFEEFEKTVTHDVSGLTPGLVNLVFELEHDYDDDWMTTVLLDHVEISVIPVPGAVLLGAIGLAFSSWKLRRRRTL